MDSNIYDAVVHYLRTGSITFLPWAEMSFYCNVCYLDGQKMLRDRATRLPVARKEQLNMLILKAHISPQSEHRNVEETIKFITSHFIPHIRKEVMRFIQDCAFCTVVLRKKSEMDRELALFIRDLQQKTTSHGSTDWSAANTAGETDQSSTVGLKFAKDSSIKLTEMGSVQSTAAECSESVAKCGSLSSPIVQSTAYAQTNSDRMAQSTQTERTNNFVQTDCLSAKELLDDSENIALSKLQFELTVKESEISKLKEELCALQTKNNEMNLRLKMATKKQTSPVTKKEVTEVKYRQMIAYDPISDDETETVDHEGKDSKKIERLCHELDRANASINQLQQGGADEKEALIVALRNESDLIHAEVAKVHAILFENV